jgi:hypothetical protein
VAIDYDHSANSHGLEGPAAALRKMFPQQMPASILDVGCGIGTWLKAALDSGVSDIVGIDGVGIPHDRLLIPSKLFICRDLTSPIDLGRHFEVVLCLEVAEHLQSSFSETLIATLTRHSDKVVFSAACPGQPGQHHVNCQWPDYWQGLFNKAGFSCEDTLRSKLWDDPSIEFWYKQNMFIARLDPQAGREPRLKTLIHPEMHAMLAKPPPTFTEYVLQIEKGRMPIGWYIKVPPVALLRKLSRRLPRLRFSDSARDK